MIPTLSTASGETAAMTHRIRSARRGAAAAALMLSTQLLAACGGILDVDLPGRVREESLDNPVLAPTLVNSAQADFECAYGEFVYSTGAWANEFLNSSGGAEVIGWGARLPNYESGNGTCQTTTSTRGAFAVYRPLQIARNQADGAITRLEGFTDAQVANRTLLIATAALYSGFTHALLGEAYCEMALSPTEPLVSRAQVLTRAEERFTKAIESAASATGATATNVVNAARVGRARVRLGLNRLTEAATDAALVPANFVYNATYSGATFRRNNPVYLVNNANFHLSVAPEYRGLTVDGTADPRVPVTNANRQGQDALTPLWLHGKYTAITSPIPLATWDEAQLILAEARGGQEAVDAINRIRARYSLPAFGGGDAETIRAQIIEERRRTLFLTGHRVGDQLRYGIPFATGANQKGVAYGVATCLPLPPAESDARG